ncbi:hypothetical protein [Nonomuraea sp. NPDC048916]|uniref:hypothetical protein n=1 Tax=Nonomuraea sp. NPDC048916 TaxID=3154232 RepID=UPI0033E943C3
MSESIPERDYRVGDILRVTCPPTTAQVAQVSKFYAFVDWPWGGIDPDSQYRWNGQVAFPAEPGSYEWSYLLFRTDPEPWHLALGDSCLVGIPETLVRVVEVIHHDPPADVGRLPRPHTWVIVLLADQPDEIYERDEEEGGGGSVIELDSFTPIRLDIVSRG